MPQIYSPNQDRNCQKIKPLSLRKIKEGGRRIIYAIPDNSGDVIVESKPVITKGNGKVSVSWNKEAEFANRIACNIFRFIDQCFNQEKTVVPISFIRQMGTTMFRARFVKMFRLEVVSRRIAMGTYLKRNPDVKEGTRLEQLEIELFYKDDAMNDPQIHPKTGGYDIFDPMEPMSSSSYLGELPENTFMPDDEQLKIIARYQRMIFEALEKAFKKEGITLIDLKCEYGIFTDENGKEIIMLSGVIDNDSWHIQFDKDNTLKDKEVFRPMGNSLKQKEISLLKENYA